MMNPRVEMKHTLGIERGQGFATEGSGVFAELRVQGAMAALARGEASWSRGKLRPKTAGSAAKANGEASPDSAGTIPTPGDAGTTVEESLDLWGGGSSTSPVVSERGTG